MNRHDVATLGIRFAALYAWFNALEYFSSGIISLLFTENSVVGREVAFNPWLFITPSAFLIVVGILLFTKAPRLAVYFLPESNESFAPSTASAASPSVGFAIVGLAGCIYSVPRLVTIIVRLFQAGVFSSSNFNATDAKRQLLLQIPEISGIALQLVLSFVILVKSRALATWWQRKQTKPVS